MYEKELVKNDLSIKQGIRTLKYKKKFNKENPTYFVGDGLIVFIGSQGTGKTLSAVKYVKKLMMNYPNAKLVTNIMLKEYPVVTLQEWIREKFGIAASVRFSDMTVQTIKAVINEYQTFNRVFPFNNADDLMRYENFTEGVIYLIDEIQLYFNSLESKNINMDVMTEISQQRKQRKHIVATSQVFGRMAKPLREQFSTIVVCSNFFGLIQRNQYLNTQDLETDQDFTTVHGKVDKTQFFIHRVEDYESYDTYYKIQRTKFIAGEEKVQDIYERITNTSDAGSN